MKKTPDNTLPYSVEPRFQPSLWTRAVSAAAIIGLIISSCRGFDSKPVVVNSGGSGNSDGGGAPAENQPNVPEKEIVSLECEIGSVKDLKEVYKRMEEALGNDYLPGMTDVMLPYAVNYGAGVGEATFVALPAMKIGDEKTEDQVWVSGADGSFKRLGYSIAKIEDKMGKRTGIVWVESKENLGLYDRGITPVKDVKEGEWVMLVDPHPDGKTVFRPPKYLLDKDVSPTSFWILNEIEATKILVTPTADSPGSDKGPHTYAEVASVLAINTDTPEKIKVERIEMITPGSDVEEFIQQLELTKISVDHLVDLGVNPENPSAELFNKYALEHAEPWDPDTLVVQGLYLGKMDNGIQLFLPDMNEPVKEASKMPIQYFVQMLDMRERKLFPGPLGNTDIESGIAVTMVMPTSLTDEKGEIINIAASMIFGDLSEKQLKDLLNQIGDNRKNLLTPMFFMSSFDSILGDVLPKLILKQITQEKWIDPVTKQMKPKTYCDEIIEVERYFAKGQPGYGTITMERLDAIQEMLNRKLLLGYPATDAIGFNGPTSH